MERAGLDGWHADLSWGPGLRGGTRIGAVVGDRSWLGRPTARGAGWVARGSEHAYSAGWMGVPDAWHADRRRAGPRHQAGPRHKERRAPTLRRSAGPRHKAPGPDTKSAGPNTERRSDAQHAHADTERRAPAQRDRRRASGPDTESELRYRNNPGSRHSLTEIAGAR